jgi:[ribosomal protein S18]-alanine N-acetyltransferase
MSAVITPVLHWRPSSLQDVDALLGLEQRLYSHPWTQANFVDSLTNGHCAWQAGLAAPGPELAAYWLAMPVLDELHLLNLAVHPDHWGQGLARNCLQHLTEHAKSLNVSEIWLEVRESNHRAQMLYLRNGYVMVGRRRDYYPAGARGSGQREDALLLRKNLGCAS